MTNLRFLKFYINEGGKGNVHLPAGLESLSDKLRYLHWDVYPSKSMPSKFSPENLVVLSMMGSLVKKLWDGVKVTFHTSFYNMHNYKDKFYF